MKNIKQFLFILSAITFLSACTMVKHSPSASFQKVKYNPHLKLAKKESESINRGDEIKLNKVAIDQQEEELAENTTKTSTVHSQSIDAEKELASVRKKATSVTAKQSEANSNISEEKAAKPSFNLSPRPEAPKAAVNNVLEPLAAASDDQILDLIYIILIILLVLIVVGLIIDLSGGLLGTLIAILLILLILHLMGVI
ncbi:MAG: hypothetical protein CMP59_01155 [Flavobacteriales bacterium]|nr:hypothetical protein [Flavobacteriales bacterium]|tara:strand:- start:1972 stop:2565 length:594 start_codon:yes stop_codon:yes gene_type:complete